MNTDHRLLMRFRGQFGEGGRLSASIDAEENDYLSLGDGAGNRVTVTVQPEAGAVVLNHEAGGALGPYFYGARAKGATALDLALEFGESQVTLVLPEGGRVRCAVPFDLAGLRFAEGRGAWRNLEAAFA